MAKVLKYIYCQWCLRPYPRSLMGKPCPDCDDIPDWQPWDPNTMPTPEAPLIAVLEEFLEYVESDGHTAYEDGGMFYYVADAIVYLCQHYAHREDYYLEEEAPDAHV